MRIFNKMLLSGLGALTLVSVFNPAYADETKKEEEDTSDVGAIIFRIENIQPVTNKDGLIDKCNFIVTAFNRMDKAVKEAKLKFSWEDNISGKFSLSGQDIKVNKGKSAKTIVSAAVTMNDIASHTQKSFQASVDTDKCFLLFDNLTYTVDSCLKEGEKVQVKNSKIVNKGKGCAGNFDYIDSKNPEYYSEFKDVPESVIAKQAEKEKSEEVAQIKTEYENAMKDLQNINSTLAEIK